MALPKLPLIKVLLVVLAITVLGASGGAYIFYTKYQTAQKLLQNPTLAGEQEIDKYVKEIGNYILLPSGEKPTLATVSDTDKLKDQPFFAESANGDKLLIFQTAKMALLYRPSIQKIVMVAYNVDSKGQTQAAVPSPTTLAQAPVASVSGTPVLGEQKVVSRVAFYNGTTTPGLTNLAEKGLAGKMEYRVVIKESATITTYEKTQVVVLNESMSAYGQKLATQFNGEITTLPEGEKKPEADLLVILGKTFLAP